jgi:hypothetical protein
LEGLGEKGVNSVRGLANQRFERLSFYAFAIFVLEYFQHLKGGLASDWDPFIVEYRRVVAAVC